jgi:H+/Cl- antiporter ClcA
MQSRNRIEERRVLAYDYPLLGAFWTLALFSLFVLVIFVIIWAFVDNFRRKDHSGWAKAVWFFFIIFFPLLGVFVYLLARPADPPV